MITNDWQLRVTQKRIKDFENALFELGRLPKSKSQPWLRAAQRESLESEMENLCKQVEEYELLKSGQVALPGPEVIQQVPELLIKTRISKGLNQEELASMLGVSKQCIQQYEQTNYAHVTLSTAQRVMQALSGLGLNPAAGSTKTAAGKALSSSSQGKKPPAAATKPSTASKKAAKAARGNG